MPSWNLQRKVLIKIFSLRKRVDTIKEVSEKGFSDSMYDLIGVFGIILAILISVWYGKKLGLKFYQILLIES